MSFVRLLAPGHQYSAVWGWGVTRVSPGQWTLDTVQPRPSQSIDNTDMTCFLFAVKCAVNIGSVSPHCTATLSHLERPPGNVGGGHWYSHTSDTLQGSALKHLQTTPAPQINI